MRYKDLRELATKKANTHLQLRIGQAYMLALHELDPQLYGEITGTIKDPFYDDKKMKEFNQFLVFEKGIE